MRWTHPIRTVGIVGLGSIGRRHVRILNSLCPDLTISTYRTKKGALQDPVDGVAELGRNTFLDSCFDLVVISNPSALHLDTLETVLRANPGSTILVEKPFCLPDQLNRAKLLMARYPD